MNFRYNIPGDTLKMHTDDNRGDGVISGSGVFIKHGHGIEICRKKSALFFVQSSLFIKKAMKYLCQ